MQNSNYEVSILIPTYNRSNLIRNAIESSLIQTQKCEIIVCDHGSNDGTLELCKSYGDSITYVRRDKDYGIHFCELESILSANGKYIHFCFDDDWMHPRFIEECMAMMDDSTGIVYSRYELVDLDSDFSDKTIWDFSMNIRRRKIHSYKENKN